jgi:ATP-dependent Clp protease ATP-binding subunit ClpX
LEGAALDGEYQVIALECACERAALVIEDDVLGYIVDKSIEFKLGARGLRSLFETIMIDVMYQAPSLGTKRYVLTKEFAQRQLDKSNFDILGKSL